MNQKFKVKRQLLAGVALVALIAGISSCEKYSFLPPQINPVDTIYFSTVIQPIFTDNCITCHGALRAPDLREGKSYEALKSGGFVTQPGDQSLLYLQLNKSDHEARTSDLEKLQILTWINQGALDN